MLIMTWLVRFFLVAGLLFAQAMPRITTVEPTTGKAGAEITASGEELSKSVVLKLLISDGKKDVELKLTAQEDKLIKFTIPEGLQPGRYGLAVVTKDKIIDQPVKVTVE